MIGYFIIVVKCFQGCLNCCICEVEECPTSVGIFFKFIPSISSTFLTTFEQGLWARGAVLHRTTLNWLASLSSSPSLTDWVSGTDKPRFHPQPNRERRERKISVDASEQRRVVGWFTCWCFAFEKSVTHNKNISLDARSLMVMAADQ